MNPTTTDGIAAISSMVGFTHRRYPAERNCEVYSAPSTPIGTAKSSP